MLQKNQNASTIVKRGTNEKYPWFGDMGTEMGNWSESDPFKKEDAETLPPSIPPPSNVSVYSAIATTPGIYL